jgi:inhibitor of cysteine peptidase
MRRFLVLFLMAVVAACLAAGCAGAETYTDAGQTISTGVNQQFNIALESNPTTGYSWQESYDNAMLELVDKTYEPGEGAQQGLVGAGGTEHFRFKALKAGETEITLTYKRPWEEESLEQKVFRVSIK